MRSELAEFPGKRTLGVGQYLWLIAALLLPCGVPAQEIFVDDDAGAPGFTQTIPWLVTGNPSAGWNSGKYRYRYNYNSLSTVTWTPTIPTEGIYEVATLFRRGGDRTGSAPFTVHHADGSTTVPVDQTGEFGGSLGEVALGSYRFLPGTSGKVTLSNTGGSGAHIADTIRFRPDPPPVITNTTRSPVHPQESQPITMTGRITDNTALQSVDLRWRLGDTGPFSTEPAHDDGAHGDQAAGDSIFGAQLPGFENEARLSFFFEAIDEFDSATTSPQVDIVIGAQATWELVINEVLPSNVLTSADPDIDGSGDWIEIYNHGPYAADLSRVAISDDSDTPARWTFPVGAVLNAGEYLIVWCDGEDFVGHAYHTNFKLSSGGETALLYDLDTEEITDQIDYPELGADVAYARLPNLGMTWIPTVNPTPAAANLTGNRGDAPTFSQPSGLYAGSVSVEIVAPGAVSIRYTTDGSEPTGTSPLYSIPLTFTSHTGLRARAYYATFEPSLVTSASYFFDAVPDRVLPIVDVIIDPAHLAELLDPQNVEERGFAWERPVHVMMMNPDGSQMHETGAGIRLHGGTTRDENKKSFRIYLRNLYGQSEWSVPWLERSDSPAFSQMVFRAGGNDVFFRPETETTYLRDQLMRDWLAAEGEFAADGFFAALYINGVYNGLYNMTERISDDLMEHTYGGEDWDIIKGAWASDVKYFTAATDGTMDAWDAFLAWVESSDLSTPADYAELQTRIDLDNYLKWMALNIACQNHDWPQNNWIATQRLGDPTSLWTFHEWDSEWPLGYRPTGWQEDSLEWAQGDNYHTSSGHNHDIAPLCQLFNGSDWDPTPTGTINGILDNPQGRLDFIQAMENVLNFTMAPENTIPDLNAMAASIETEIPREAQLWNDDPPATEVAQWHSAVANMRTFLTNRPDFVRGLMTAEFGIAGTRKITFQVGGTGTGSITVNGRHVELPWTGTFFDNSDIDLEALADGGFFFEGWSGGFTESLPSTVHTVSSGPDTTITVSFGQPGNLNGMMMR